MLVNGNIDEKMQQSDYDTMSMPMRKEQKRLSNTPASIYEKRPRPSNIDYVGNACTPHVQQGVVVTKRVFYVRPQKYYSVRAISGDANSFANVFPLFRHTLGN